MLLNAVVILVVLASVLMWSSKTKGYGLLSALLHFLCVVVAGAVAFAAWEPLVYGMLLGVDRLEPYAWGLGLVLPFAATLALLRLAVDTLVKANMDFDDATNFAGGAIFGGAAGIITAGIFVLSVSFTRLPREFLMYNPLDDKGGNLVYAQSLWVPVDKLTVSFYEHLSVNAFGSDTPLAVWQPRAYEQAAMMRVTLEDKGRTTLQPDAFEVNARYRVPGATASELLAADGFSGRSHAYQNTDGEPPSGKAEIHGFVVTFNSGAQEAGGQIVLGNGHMRLVCELNDEPRSIAVQPLAIIAEPEAGAASRWRFRFDAPDTYIPSVGAGSKMVVGVEFLVPGNAKPVALMIKNVRVPLEGARLGTAAVKEYTSLASRDSAVVTGAIFSEAGISSGVAGLPIQGQGQGVEVSDDNIFMANQLPNAWVVQKGTEGGIKVVPDESGRLLLIVDGEHRFIQQSLKNFALDRSLQVRTFQARSDTSVVQVKLADGQALTPIGAALTQVDWTGHPTLADDKGNRYECLGYVYGDGNEATIRYTPSRPIASLADIPQLTSSKRDQTLYLIFQVTKGVKITSFVLADKEIARIRGAGLSVVGF